MTIVTWLVTILSHAALNIHRSVSLLVTHSGLECALTFQGNFSLHDAAISELMNYLNHSNHLKQLGKVGVLKVAVCYGRDLN